MSILKDTKRSKYKDLQMLVCEAWGLIANGAQCSDIKILTDIICSNFQSTNDSKSNYGEIILVFNFYCVIFSFYFLQKSFLFYFINTT